MVVIPGPVEFWMGSPTRSRIGDNEDCTANGSAAPFAIAANP